MKKHYTKQNPAPALWDGYSSHPGRGNTLNHVAVHGGGGGLLRVDILRKAAKDSPNDYIVLSTRRSRGKKVSWLTMRDDEALVIARLLLWAVQARMNPDVVFEKVK